MGCRISGSPRIHLEKWYTEEIELSKIDRVLENERFEPLVEAPLPEGFPGPGPLGRVVVKNYPKYRAARVEGGNSFWTLFQHIKRNDVQMTAPVAQMSDEEWQVRGVATLAIGQFGEQTPATTVNAVAKNLKDEHASVRNAAAVALGEFGPAARARIPDLRAAESDEDPAVRKSAGQSIGKVMGIPEEGLE